MGSILEGYAAAATPAFIAAYEALSPEQIYENVLDLFTNRHGKIADIGAGTGRDAAWFAGKGEEVFAVEPVRKLREAGQSLHPSDKITWVDDRLPYLSKLQTFGPFDMVNLCAVWQHIPDDNRAIAMANIAGVMVSGGLLVISLRHGPGAKGREVFSVSTDATIEMAQADGLRLIRRREADSVQVVNQAMGVSWTWLAFENIR